MSSEPQPVVPYDTPGGPTNIPYATPEAATQLMAAQAAWKPLRRAARYATAEAWTLALCAVVSLTPCFAGGWVGVVLAVVLGGVAAVEFGAARRLQRLDLAAPKRLAVNQLVLGAAVVIYSAVNFYLVSVGRGMMAELNAHPSQLGEEGAEAQEMIRSVLYVLYGSLIAAGVFMQGGTAWFYATREAKLRDYLANTPGWLVQMQRDRGSL